MGCVCKVVRYVKRHPLAICASHLAVLSFPVEWKLKLGTRRPDRGRQRLQTPAPSNTDYTLATRERQRRDTTAAVSTKLLRGVQNDRVVAPKCLAYHRQ